MSQKEALSENRKQCFYSPLAGSYFRVLKRERAANERQPALSLLQQSQAPGNSWTF